MIEYLFIILKGILGGAAALGFAVMFNVPKRTLLSVFYLGAVGVTVKFIALLIGISIILSSLFGAALIGFLCQVIAIRRQTPPLVIAIPSVIPMVPGVFLYKMMIAVIRLSSTSDNDIILQLIAETTTNGLKAVFILLALSLGISLPYLILRRDTLNYVKKSQSKEKNN